MKITILGSGSKGNSTFIDLGHTRILIDVGFSYKQIKQKLDEIGVDAKTIDALLITHDHTDHTYGLKVFLKNVKPLLYTTPEIEKSILGTIYENTIYLNAEQNLNGIKITTIPTSHDALTSNGYLIEYEQESLVYITDTGYINQRYLKLIKNKTYYIFESNHDPEMLIKGPYPKYLQDRILSDKGHLSNELAAGYLSRIIGPDTKQVILAHLSESNNTPEVALKTVNKILKENLVNFQITICASQHTLTEVKEW